jgi:hypothetical protein
VMWDTKSYRITAVQKIYWGPAGGDGRIAGVKRDAYLVKRWEGDFDTRYERRDIEKHGEFRGFKNSELRATDRPTVVQ